MNSLTSIPDSVRKNVKGRTYLKHGHTGLFQIYTADLAQIKAKEAIQKEEDIKIFTAINAVVP